MPLTLDKIEVVTDFKHLQIREITGEGKFHRRVLASDMTLADDEHQEVKDKAEEVWTDKVKSAWVKHKEEHKVIPKPTE